MHLVSHHNGLHAVLRCSPSAMARRWTPRGPRIPASFTLGVAGRGRDRGRLRRPRTPSGCAGRGLGLRITDAASELTPFSGTYLFTDPVDGAHVFTSYETGRRYRVTVLARRAAPSRAARPSAPPTRSVVLGSDGAGWEAAVER